MVPDSKAINRSSLEESADIFAKHHQHKSRNSDSHSGQSTSNRSKEGSINRESPAEQQNQALSIAVKGNYAGDLSKKPTSPKKPCNVTAYDESLVFKNGSRI